MIRSDLVNMLAAGNPDLQANDADKIVATFFDSITNRLAAGGRVEIRGFGAFTTRERAARVGRNPRSGAAVDVKAKRMPFFKPGKELRERIDSSAAD